VHDLNGGQHSISIPFLRQGEISQGACQATAKGKDQVFLPWKYSCSFTDNFVISCTILPYSASFCQAASYNPQKISTLNALQTLARPLPTAMLLFLDAL
jgi:hypothetical protein